MYANPHYSTEKAMSNVVDNQSPNALAADSDSDTNTNSRQQSLCLKSVIFLN